MMHSFITFLSFASLILLPFTVLAQQDGNINYGVAEGQDDIQSSAVVEKRQGPLNLPPVQATMILSYICKGEPLTKKSFTTAISVVNGHFVFVRGQNVDAIEGAFTQVNYPYYSGHARFKHTYCAPPSRGSRCVYTYLGTYVTSAFEKIIVGSSSAGEAGVVPPRVTKTCQSMVNKPSSYCPPVSPTAEDCTMTNAQVIVN